MACTVLGYIFRFPADTLSRASGGCGLQSFHVPSSFFAFSRLSTASSIFVHTLFFLVFFLTRSFTSGLACLLACNFLTMSMTNHTKKLVMEANCVFQYTKGGHKSEKHG